MPIHRAAISLFAKKKKGSNLSLSLSAQEYRTIQSENQKVVFSIEVEALHKCLKQVRITQQIKININYTRTKMVTTTTLIFHINQSIVKRSQKFHISFLYVKLSEDKEEKRIHVDSETF